MATTDSASTKTYHWKGVNKIGQTVDGQMDTASPTVVKAEMRRQGIAVKKIYRKHRFFNFKYRKKIGQTDITFFSRQLATMLTAGIPLVQSLDIIIRSQSNDKFGTLITKIKTEVESGNTVSQSLKQHPRYFNELYCSLVNAGEQSGALDVIFAKIAIYKERIEIIKSKIKKALFYPTAVLTVAFLVTAALLIFVVPQFETLFKNFGADLPYMTRIIISLSQIVAQWWWIILGVIVSSITGIIYLYRHSKKFTVFLDHLSLRLPLIGTILKKAAIARFSRTLSITFAAGLPLVEALQTVSSTTGNSLYANATLQIKDEVATGQPMHVSMKKTSLFPDMVIQMIGIGEESGSLEQMLSKVADYYEREVDDSVDNISTLLEPAIMVILGVLVGGLVIAMYLPIFKLGSVV